MKTVQKTWGFECLLPSGGTQSWEPDNKRQGWMWQARCSNWFGQLLDSFTRKGISELCEISQLITYIIFHLRYTVLIKWTYLLVKYVVGFQLHVYQTETPWTAWAVSIGIDWNDFWMLMSVKWTGWGVLMHKHAWAY